VYVTEATRVRAVALATGAVSTVAGSNQWGLLDGASGAAALIGGPTALALHPATGVLYIAGENGCLIRSIAPAQAGATLTTANLGSALSEFGRVTLIDAATPRRGRALTSLFGLTGTEQGTGKDHLDLWLLADRLALQPESGLLPLTPDTSRNFQSIAAAADFVLVDGPAVDDPDSVGAMRQLVDAVVLVIRPADLGTGRYERALDRLQGMKVAGVMVNGATDDVLSAER
jgi:hypothetical protein